MRRFLLILLLLVVSLALAPVVTAQSPWLTISGRGFTVAGQQVTLRGTNFANINALGARTDDGRIGTGNPATVTTTQSDYTKLKAMGGNVVRFGLDYYWYANAKTAMFTMLDKQVAYAKNAGVWMMLLSFGNPDGASDSCYEGYSRSCSIWGDTAEQQRLIDMWKEIVTRYRDEPTVFAIDPVNEPTVGQNQGWDTNVYWKVAERLRDAVVAINPNILVSIEAGSDALFWRTLGPNVIYQAHYYTPLAGTHCVYGGERVAYPGNAPLWDGARPLFNKANLNDPSSRASIFDAMPAVQWSKDNNVPLFVGEWGIASDSCFTGGYQYMADVADAFNKNGLHWAYYSWEASEQRWGTFPESESLTPYSQVKYNMLLGAFGQTVTQPTPVATATKTAPAGTLTPTRTPVPPSATPASTLTSRPSATPLVPTATPTCPGPYVTGDFGGTPFYGCFHAS